MSRFLHSHSADDEKFGHCRAAYLLYQQGAPKGQEPENFAFGRTGHLVMQYYVDHCVERRRRSDITVIPDMIDRAVRATGMHWKYYGELRAVTEAFLRCYEIDVEHSLTREGGIAFDDDFNVVPWSEAVEYDVMTKPGEQRGAIFWRCKLDHALLYPEDRTLVIQDYKFDVYAPSPSKLIDPSSRFYKQALKYAWAAWRAFYPADVVRVEFVFARHLYGGRPLVREISFTKDEILATQDLVAAEAHHIEETVDFPATPGDHCVSCAYRDTACPIRSERVTDEPASIMRQFLYQQVLQTQRRARLKDLVSEFGYDGELGPLRAAFEATEERIADMKRVWETLVSYGVENPWAIMKLSDTDAQHILDKDVYEELIAAAYDTSLRVKFNVHQRKDVLVALCEERGIPTTKVGATKVVQRTVVELAWDLAVHADQAATPIDGARAVDVPDFVEFGPEHFGGFEPLEELH